MSACETAFSGCRRARVGVGHLAKDGVLVVQVRERSEADEELRAGAVGIRAARLVRVKVRVRVRVRGKVRVRVRVRGKVRVRVRVGARVSVRARASGKGQGQGQG